MAFGIWVLNFLVPPKCLRRDTNRVPCNNMNLFFQQHDSPTGLDGANFSVFVHGDHEQAVHHPLLPLTGVHQQVGSAGRAGNLDKTQVCCKQTGNSTVQDEHTDKLTSF